MEKTKEKGRKLQAQKTTTTTPSQNVGEESKEKKRGEESISYIVVTAAAKDVKPEKTTRTALLHCSTVTERARIPVPGSSAAGIENVIWNVIKQRNGPWKHGEFSAPTSTARHSSSRARGRVGNTYFIRADV
jgi:hypothetical protein